MLTDEILFKNFTPKLDTYQTIYSLNGNRKLYFTMIYKNMIVIKLGYT